MGSKRGIAGALGTALALTASIGALGPAATAAPTSVECAVTGAKLRIESTGPDITVARRGDAVVVRDYRGRIPCAGDPTVHSINTITTRGGDVTELDLREGLLEPGLTPEADGSDEIEVTAYDGEATVLLDDISHHVLIGERDDAIVVDFDAGPGAPEPDLHVMLPTPFVGELNLKAGAGDDVLSAGPNAFVLPFRQYLSLSGGPGDDRIIGERERSQGLFGGGGDDRISAGRADDIVAGGPGADRIRAGRGPDIVVAGGGRDRLDCGKGRDTYRAKSPPDRLRHCERAVAELSRPFPRP